jgi:hypothetical protein
VSATELPTWAVYALSFGSPALTFAGVAWSQRAVRHGAKELDRRATREEVMRNLRWAAELAVGHDADAARLGVAELVALGASDLLDGAAKSFVTAALAVVVRDPAQQLGGPTATGDESVVVGRAPTAD